MPGSWIDDQIWTAAQPQAFNGESAIYKYWRQLRGEGTYLGVPITPEVETPVGIQQGFSSGAVINWNADEGASVASE